MSRRKSGSIIRTWAEAARLFQLLANEVTHHGSLLPALRGSLLLASVEGSAILDWLALDCFASQCIALH